MVAPVIIAGLAATSILSGVAELDAAQGEGRANQRINDIEAKRRGVENAISRRRALAASRQLEAAARSQALAAGVGLSSGNDANIGGIDSATSSEISIQRQNEQFDLSQDAQTREAQRARDKASKFGFIGGLAGSIGSALS